MSLHLWIIPLLPLAGAAINGLLGKRFPKTVVNLFALGSTAAAFVYALWVATQFVGLPADQIPHIERYATWVTGGTFSAEYGTYLDQLSLVMLLIVTGVGFLIHVYSVGYMEHEGGYYRYFAYLNLFMFFMLTLVLANNYLLMFVGWEGVGLASYLLIGFWFLKKSAADAGKKAFITTRVGDFGFLIALFLLIKHFGTHPRRNNGDSRCVHGCAVARDLRPRARCHAGGGGDWHPDGDFCGLDRLGAAGH